MKTKQNTRAFNLAMKRAAIALQKTFPYSDDSRCSMVSSDEDDIDEIAAGLKHILPLLLEAAVLNNNIAPLPVKEYIPLLRASVTDSPEDTKYCEHDHPHVSVRFRDSTIVYAASEDSLIKCLRNASVKFKLKITPETTIFSVFKDCSTIIRDGEIFQSSELKYLNDIIREFNSLIDGCVKKGYSKAKVMKIVELFRHVRHDLESVEMPSQLLATLNGFPLNPSVKEHLALISSIKLVADSVST